MQTDLSVLDVDDKGVDWKQGLKTPQPSMQVDVSIQADDVRSKEGSPVVLRLPPNLGGRPEAAFSRVDIQKLPESTPLTTTMPSTPLYNIGGGKDLELVLRVLLYQGGRPHVLRALVDTGAKVPLIIRTGLVPSTLNAPSPLHLVTADGTPMQGGTTGCTCDVKIPIAVPYKKN